MSVDYDCVFPPDYESEELLWESKGYVIVHIVTSGEAARRFTVMVYDPIRLQQDIETEFKSGRAAFFEVNLVVVERVTRAAVIAVIEELAKNDFESLVPDP